MAAGALSLLITLLLMGKLLDVVWEKYGDGYERPASKIA